MRYESKWACYILVIYTFIWIIQHCNHRICVAANRLIACLLVSDVLLLHFLFSSFFSIFFLFLHFIYSYTIRICYLLNKFFFVFDFNSLFFVFSLLFSSFHLHFEIKNLSTKFMHMKEHKIQIKIPQTV